MAQSTRGVTATCVAVVFPVTSVRDGLEHLVTDEAMTIGNPDRYLALCGHRVLAAALVCPPGPPCPTCVAVRSADAAGDRRHRRTAWSRVWARLADRLRGRSRQRHTSGHGGRLT